MEPDFDLICDYYSRLERQGPGSPEMTKKALGYVQGLSPESCIADIGCGTGGQTVVLAQEVSGGVVGVDMLEPFVDRLNQQAKALGLQDRLSGKVASMDCLPFKEGEFDLIWSEGAIYNIGFEHGLKTWRKFLKSGGYIAVSEICWLTDERPDEINDFWCAAYPEIDTVANKEAVMNRAGYEVVASFVLPASCWIDNYYAPQTAIIDEFLKKHDSGEAAKALVAEQREEAELFQRFKDYYSYGFFIGKKV